MYLCLIFHGCTPYIYNTLSLKGINLKVSEVQTGHVYINYIKVHGAQSRVINQRALFMISVQ